MILSGTHINIVDNTGAKIAKCIKVLGGIKKKFAKVGDKIVVSIKKSNLSTKIKEGDIYYAIIIRTKKQLVRKTGVVVKFFDNAGVLINKEGNLVGTRIFGIVPKEIKDRNYLKIISLAQEIS